MSKSEMLPRMKGLFAALLVLTLGVLAIIPLTSTLLENGEKSFMSDMTIYVVLLAVWILLAIAFTIIYLTSEGGRTLAQIALPGRG